MNEQNKIELDASTEKITTTDTWRQRAIRSLKGVICFFFRHEYVWATKGDKCTHVGFCFTCEQRFIKYADNCIVKLEDGSAPE